MKRGLLQMSGVVIDFLHKVDRLPAPGEEARSNAALLMPGGGFNAMAAARRLGADVAYGGALGVGPFADIACAALAAENIPAEQTRRMSGDQGVCVVLAEPNGERSYVLHSGAERAATAADLAAIPTAEFAWAMFGGYAAPDPPEVDMYGAFIQSLPRGLRLLFDPTPLVLGLDPSRVAVALARADWVSANRREAEALTGKADAARAVGLLAAGREGAIVRDGEHGCWLATADIEATHIAGFAVETVDTTGAGDTHDGAFVAAMLGGRPPLVAARFANAAAALSVTRLGPSTGPRLAEALAFLAERDTDPIWRQELTALRAG
jgi:sugar/nucleoside kinase (ribokinase family)